MCCGMFFVAPFGEVGHGVEEATELRRRELGQAERTISDGFFSDRAW